MCADPKMKRLLWSELRDELASRRAARSSGNLAINNWPHMALAAAACLVLLIVL